MERIDCNRFPDRILCTFPIKKNQYFPSISCFLRLIALITDGQALGALVSDATEEGINHGVTSNRSTLPHIPQCCRGRLSDQCRLSSGDKTHLCLNVLFSTRTIAPFSTVIICWLLWSFHAQASGQAPHRRNCLLHTLWHAPQALCHNQTFFFSSIQRVLFRDAILPLFRHLLAALATIYLQERVAVKHFIAYFIGFCALEFQRLP